MLPRNSASFILLIASLVTSQPSVEKFSVPETILSLATRINAASDNTGNYVFSPLGISTALNLLLLGAEGDTKQQLRSFLKYRPEVPDNRVHDVFSNILNKLNEGQDEVEIKIANGVITQRGLGLESNYVESSKKYKTETGTLDFKNAPETALNTINNWVAEKTSNKITQLLAQPPPSGTKMIILNAIYFKGQWENPFPVEQTRTDAFSAPDGPTSAEYMVNVLTVPYAESTELDCKAIVLPYKGLQYGMLFLLPNGDDPQAVQKLEAKLSVQSINQLMEEDMKFRSTTVRIPKFKIRQSFSVRPTLQRAGAGGIFGTGANLSRITRDPVVVDDILHQAFIEVTEDGTEAAAATGITLSRDAPSKNFIANKPFAFIIRHNRLDLSLFHGRVVKP
ncbi:serpin B3-like isoform X2 [Artemia franciscana]|uniref:Serpin domain-containing protein n=2 Tax=Artemia franciscana TaxID=6661 RepID=A0AA88LJI6_ARTSF|nr:hypothetical protein QYM36_000894 [Artemia franciscana]KAK2724186.1 hypothetical protein QYM36_000894 [Artemia franciscana]